jgi:GNAT superfamily N-acetyltransferase
VLALIRALADYEKLTPPGDEAAARFLMELAAEPRRFDVLIAERGGGAVGYALYFETYSTFSALPKLYIEDLFVLPAHRSTGAGLALFRAAARVALERRCAALEWQVLEWNRLAIDFYERLGGEHKREWLNYRLDGDALGRVASL